MRIQWKSDKKDGIVDLSNGRKEAHGPQGPQGLYNLDLFISFTVVYCLMLNNNSVQIDKRDHWKVVKHLKNLISKKINGTKDPIEQY